MQFFLCIKNVISQLSKHYNRALTVGHTNHARQIEESALFSVNKNIMLTTIRRDVVHKSNLLNVFACRFFFLIDIGFPSFTLASEDSSCYCCCQQLLLVGFGWFFLNALARTKGNGMEQDNMTTTKTTTLPYICILNNREYQLLHKQRRGTLTLAGY